MCEIDEKRFRQNRARVPQDLLFSFQMKNLFLIKIHGKQLLLFSGVNFGFLKGPIFLDAHTDRGLVPNLNPTPNPPP